jgi:hypothetical protein
MNTPPPSISMTKSLTALYTRSGRKHLVMARRSRGRKIELKSLGNGAVSGASRSYQFYIPIRVTFGNVISVV